MQSGKVGGVAAAAAAVLVVMLMAAMCPTASYAQADLPHTAPAEDDAMPAVLQSLRMGGTLTCDVCVDVMDALHDVVTRNGSVEDIEFFLSDLCHIFGGDVKDMSPAVCNGMAREYVPEVVEIVGIHWVSAAAVCDHFFHCSSSSSSSSPSSSSSSPSSSGTEIPVPKGAAATDSDVEVGYFIQLTDIHMDEMYQPGTAVDCDTPLCCEAQYGAGSAAYWGEYKCDGNLPMFLSLMKELRTNWVPKIDFLVYTGDTPRHNIWNQTREYNLGRERAVMDLLYSELGPSLKVYPSLGNHEAEPCDQFQPYPNNTWMTYPVAQMWSRWLPQEALSTVQVGGYYTISLSKALRLVVVNTQYYDLFNFWMLLDIKDPSAQLVWLEAVLANSRAAGQRVILVGHIPPMAPATQWNYGQRYIQLLEKYADVLTAQLYGHTHRDSAHVMMDLATNSTPVLTAFVAPSVTTFTDINPSFRVYEYDRATGEILDYHQYHLDLLETIRTNQTSWELYYSARAAFGVPDMSPASWLGVARRLWTDRAFLEQALTLHQTQTPTDNCIQDAGCVAQFICYTVSSTLQQVASCAGMDYSPEFVLEEWLNSLC